MLEAGVTRLLVAPEGIDQEAHGAPNDDERVWVAVAGEERRDEVGAGSLCGHLTHSNSSMALSPSPRDR